MAVCYMLGMLLPIPLPTEAYHKWLRHSIFRLRVQAGVGVKG